MKRFIQPCIVIFFSLLQTQCSNIFTPYSVQDSDKALLYEAKQKIDSGDYEEAITLLESMSSSAAAQNSVRLVAASAYAGACGMEFIPFFSSISETDLTSVSLFQYLRASMVGTVATPARCIDAEAKLLEIGATSATRLSAMGGNSEVNMLMALVSMAKIGSILRTKSDTNGTGGLGDGTTDGTFNSCTNNASNLTNAEILEIGTGFALFMENLPSLLGSGSSASSVLDGVVLLIGTYCGLSPASKCVSTTTSAVAPADQAEFIDTYRDLLKTSAMGVEACAPALPTLTDSCCP